MITVKELKPNVYELTLEGVLEKSDIETMERELTPALKGDGPLGLIVRAEGWSDITADAIAEDMKFEFGLLAQWSKVARMALVSDLQAFAALMKWVDPILPMIEMKSFGSDGVAAAEAFVSDLPAKTGAGSGRGATLLSDGSDGVIAYEIDGPITAEDLDKVMAPLEPYLKGDKKIDLLVRIKSYEGFDPSILTDGSFMGSKIGAISHVGRYAIIGAPEWMATMVGSVGAIMPFEMRMFDHSEEDAAWAWVRRA
ncbi:STAS/SEC14 domain-containing protein [Roseovarius sp. S4756]|uniref:STAS/SEC14 domain-containing protein n=1 Tax=Roseovarius maritimus TaxID=3342637 RepID=UPI00372C5F89